MDNELKRVNMNLPSSLLDIIDSERKKLNLNRTSYITMALSIYLNQQNAMQTLQAFANLPTDKIASYLNSDNDGDGYEMLDRNKERISNDDFITRKKGKKCRNV